MYVLTPEELSLILWSVLRALFSSMLDEEEEEHFAFF